MSSPAGSDARWRWLEVVVLAFVAATCLVGARVAAVSALVMGDAPPASSISVPPGFAVDLIASAQSGEGSWVALTFADEHTAFIASQGGKLFRATLSKDGSKVDALVEVIVPFHGAQGLCFTDGTLFVVAEGEVAQGGGIWRLTGMDEQGQFKSVERMFEVGGGGEHGPHGIRLGKDGKLYVIFGNHVAPPSWLDPSSPVAHWAEDFLQEREWDARGHAVGILAPGGFVAQIDPKTGKARMFAAGMRNSYDLVQGPDDEWFTYDSDMEWDIGAPWYRSPRVVHLVSGGDSGWRSGSPNSPNTYFEQQPAVCETDPASPTGVEWGGGGNFPESWRNCVLIGDWSYGRILCVDLTADGAGYNGKWKVFAHGKPMPVTDMSWGVGRDLYFTTGGRGLQSGLYRVRVTDPKLAAQFPSDQTSASTEAKVSRLARHSLEEFHARAASTSEVALCCAALESDDPMIRSAARVALENQPNVNWRELLAQCKSDRAKRSLLLALARTGTLDGRKWALTQACATSASAQTPEDRAQLARIATIVLSRGGADDALPMVGAAMDSWYPSGNATLDEQLLPILVEAKTPGIQERALATPLASDASGCMRILLALRSIKDGWSATTRRQFAQALASARTLRGGLSLQGFVDAIEADAMAAFLKEMPEAAMTRPDKQENRSPILPALVREGHPVHEWTVEELTGALNFDARSRNIERGSEVFKAASCVSCHRFAGDGGATGPDLTGAGSRFTRRDLLITTLEPSLVVSDQYADEIITTKDGSIVIGRIVDDKPDALVVRVNPIEDERETVLRSDIASRTKCDISPMPRGLLNSFSRDEIIDLLAYLESGPVQRAAH